MKRSLRVLVEQTLPPFLATYIVAAGRSIKRSMRCMRRFSYGRGKPFLKEIYALGVRFQILLDPVRNSGVDDDIARTGIWEEALSAAMKKHLFKGCTFLDIGANIGYHSLFAAAYLEDDCTIYSFEPLQHLCAQLKRSIDANKFKSITVCNFGLSTKDGEAILHIREENTGGSTLLDLEHVDTFKSKASETVALRRLDDCLPEDGAIDLIKIDVEGYELEALSGGRKLLARSHPVIFMEFSPVFYKQESVDKPESLITFLEELGYSFYGVDGSPLDLRTWLKEGNNSDSQIDIICKASS